MGKCSSIMWNYCFPDWILYLVLALLFYFFPLNSVCMVVMLIILIVFVPNTESTVQFLTRKG